MGARQVEHSKPRWCFMIAGLACGLLLMHVWIVRPVTGQIDGLKQELFAIQEDLKDLVGARDEIWKTNDLLSSIRRQQAKFDEARVAMQNIRRFRASVEEESRRTDDALAALGDLTALQNRLIAQQDSVQEVAEVFDRLALLKQRATAEMFEIDEAESGLARLVDLKWQLADEADEIDKAQNRLDQLLILKNTVNEETDDVDTARNMIEELLTLKDQIVIQGANTQAARNNVQRLMAIRDGLIGGNAAGLDAAEWNLDQLVDLKNLINQEVVDVAKAHDATRDLLDLKDDVVYRGALTDTARKNINRLMILHDDLVAKDVDFEAADLNLHRLLKMQSSLVEIAILESTVGQAVRAFELLAKFVDLRRLGGGEVREATRTILEPHSTRLSRKSVHLNSAPPEQVDGPREPNPVKTMNDQNFEDMVPWPLYED